MAEKMVLCSFLHAHTGDSSEQVLTMQTQTSGRNGCSQSLLCLLGRTLCRWITVQQSSSLKKGQLSRSLAPALCPGGRQDWMPKFPLEAIAAPGLSSFALWCHCAQHPSPLPKWLLGNPRVSCTAWEIKT